MCLSFPHLMAFQLQVARANFLQDSGAPYCYQAMVNQLEAISDDNSVGRRLA
jgi:hypothetical protein